MRLSLLFKILLIWFLFTACQQAEQTRDRNSDQSALSSSLVPSKWSSSAIFPMNLKYGTNFSNEEVMAIENAADSWSDGVDNQLQFFNSSASNFSELPNLDAYDDGEVGVYKLTTWPEELPGSALAVTQLYGTRVNIGTDNEHILIDHADILVNYETFTFSTDQSWGYDLHTVIIHEMGHFLGLYHDKTTAEESIMYPTISRFDTNRDPKAKDVDNILDKYNTRTLASAQSSSGFARKTGSSEPITLILEMYPDGHERVQIKQEHKNEILHFNHRH